MTSTTITLESITKDDLPALSSFLQSAGLPLDGLADHLAVAIVARQGAEIVGSTALEVYGPAALLRSVAVSEPLRGTGLGSQLVETGLEAARQKRIQRLFLLTETAADWFPRFGFVPIERSAVDPAVQGSVEFTDACPASAQAMLLEISSTDC